jgi:hypothetical protein
MKVIPGGARLEIDEGGSVLPEAVDPPAAAAAGG